MGAEKKYKYIIDLLLQSQGFTNNMNKVQSQMKGAEALARKTRSVLLEMGGALGFTYGLSQMTQLIKQSVELAAKAEGVKAAFNKIDNPNLLRNLRAATSGTVSDLELMSKTVQARNFKISMEALPTYFKFASQRALETGQAVDYLVESLVVGVGRKSVLWLDNLGLSVTEINAELKKTPNFAEAVGKVIEREMKAAGTIADTTATKIQTITAEWENLKLSLGESILAKGGAGMMGVLSDWVQMISSKELRGADKLKNWIDTLAGGDNVQKWKKNREEAEKYFATLDKSNTMRYIMTYSSQLESLDEEGKLYLELAIARYKEIKEIEKGKGKKEEEIRTLEKINEEIQLYNDLIERTDVTDKATIKSHYQKVAALEKEKEAIMALKDANVDLAKIKERVNETSAGYKLGTEVPGKGKAGYAATDQMGKKDLFSRNLVTPESISMLREYTGLTTEQINALVRMNRELENQDILAEELAYTFMDLFQSMDEGFKGMAKSLMRELNRIVLQMAAKAAVFGLLKLLLPGSGLVTQGIGAFMGFAAPKMAAGGLAYGPSIVQVGEYPGAKTDPELISPLSKIKGMISSNQVVPQSMKLGLDGQGNLYAWLKYKERHLSNYR